MLNWTSKNVLVVKCAIALGVVSGRYIAQIDATSAAPAHKPVLSHQALRLMNDKEEEFAADKNGPRAKRQRGAK